MNYRGMCAITASLPPGVHQIYGRLAWLDSLRFIAIIVMVVDHALLCFMPDNPVTMAIRMTLTRCAEPLFVFVLTYLTIYLRRSMTVSRWWQLVGVSAATSSGLTFLVGHPALDVLMSIALAALVLPALLRTGRRACVALLYAAAALASLPVGFMGASFDYSPVLIVYQMLLTRLHCESHQRLGGHALGSAILFLASSCFGMSWGLPPSPAFFVALFGHPLAALLVHLVMREDEHFSTPITRLATRPLSVYFLHVTGFVTLVAVMRGSGA